MNEPEVTVGTFNDMESARRLKTTLREIGIDSEIHDDSGLQKNILLEKPLAAFHVQVRKEDVLKAEDAMNQWRDQLRGIVRCPSCGKSNIVFPQVTRKFQHSLWTVLLLCKAGLMEPSFSCEDCSYQWSARFPEPEATREVKPPEGLEKNNQRQT